MISRKSMILDCSSLVSFTTMKTSKWHKFTSHMTLRRHRSLQTRGLCYAVRPGDETSWTGMYLLASAASYSSLLMELRGWREPAAFRGRPKKTLWSQIWRCSLRPWRFLHYSRRLTYFPVFVSALLSVWVFCMLGSFPPTPAAGGRLLYSAGRWMHMWLWLQGTRTNEAPVCVCVCVEHRRFFLAWNKCFHPSSTCHWWQIFKKVNFSKLFVQAGAHLRGRRPIRVFLLPHVRSRSRRVTTATTPVALSHERFQSSHPNSDLQWTTMSSV